jgi:hypothetical protein
MRLLYKYDLPWLEELLWRTDAVRKKRKRTIENENEGKKDVAPWRWRRASGVEPCHCVLSVNKNLGTNKKEHYEDVLEVKRQRKQGDKMQGKKQVQISRPVRLFARNSFAIGDVISIATKKISDGKINDPVFILSGEISSKELLAPAKTFYNSHLTPDGVIRAVKPIVVGDEIFIDFYQQGQSPVDFLDCVVIQKGTGEDGVHRNILGKINSFAVDSSGNICYVAKFCDGSREVISSADIQGSVVYLKQRA